jgi:hypothetical protein
MLWVPARALGFQLSRPLEIVELETVGSMDV